MSDCHIWLGVARSKKRGRVRLRFLGRDECGISLARCRCWRTVSGLAGKKKHRRSNWLMRLTPKAGCCCLSSTIFLVIGSGSLGSRRLAAAGCNPASPNVRYSLIQRLRQLGTMPISAQMSSSLKPSSKRSRTALSFCSTENSRRDFFARPAPLGGLRFFFLFFSTTICSFMVTLH